MCVTLPWLTIFIFIKNIGKSLHDGEKRFAGKDKGWSPTRFNLCTPNRQFVLIILSYLKEPSNTTPLTENHFAKKKLSGNGGVSPKIFDTNSNYCLALSVSPSLTESLLFCLSSESLWFLFRLVLLKLLRRFKLLDGFIKIDIWICLSFYMHLSKLIHRFLWVATRICRCCSMLFCPLPNKTKLKLLLVEASALN